METVVTRKGQITIPAPIRKKYRIEEGRRMRFIDRKGAIVLEALPSILSLAGCGSGAADASEMRRELDRMRGEDEG